MNIAPVLKIQFETIWEEIDWREFSQKFVIKWNGKYTAIGFLQIIKKTLKM